MKLELLEIDQADQLSACKLALLLGVFTPKSQVEGFLKFARGILHSDSAILAFQNEPYVWYSSPEGFKAFQSKKEANLAAYFDGELAIGIHHPNYQKFSDHIHQLGVEHKRVIAFNLLIDDQVSIGQIVLFDDHDEPFVEENLSLVQEFAMSLIRIIELRADYSELKELYEQQLALNFSKTKFFQVIAHDLRAPFHGLLGFSEVLAEERATLSDREVQDIAEYLNDTAQSTYNLLESLLNWAMAEGGRFVYHPMNFQLKQVSKIVYDVLNTLAVKKNIQLIENVPEDLKVYADINMITSVVQNIVSNALKFTYTDGTGKVSIEAKACDNGVEISIQDTGLGMTPQQIEGLFKPNLQVSIKGTFGEKGAGLGLVLCKRFVDINHGQISVESEQGRGTTFKVILPTEAQVHPIVVDHESIQQDQINKQSINNQIEKIS
ncbi:HAMP domain-containing histidine kinase [Acinetobacter sp. 194]|uniref:sensor histidine kinase n=1 Tax=Acinetobacter shaoyimingii TaxID=2715164 RepID=UPI001409347C|nr:HAMP domain-containing sensor histidine kinase [Acinetobacter shaoyimingii]NHB58737.1 HAMP domain-containing histidine kinase [Acinetobacter shaoyimingii]